MDFISSGNLTISVSVIWYKIKITNTLEGREDDRGAFHTSDWVFYGTQLQN